jgi:hypothetical protein
MAVGGCSLLTIKSPERPLSKRDLNTRLLTRELSTQFVAAAQLCAEDIALAEKDPVILQNGLRWEIAAVTYSRRAATQTAPLMALLDSWALAEQMAAFTGAGAPGGDLFGVHQECIRQVSNGYAESMEALAKGLLSPKEFNQYRQFVEGYAHEYPLQDIKFARVSVVETWSREQGANAKLIDSMGTIPEALTDVADRLQIYADTVPSQVMWKTQLALQESGYSGTDVQAALKELDDRLAAMTAVADSSPERIHDAVMDLRRSLLEVIARMDAAAAATLTRVGTERAAFVADLRTERQATLAAVDVQRQAIAVDAARIADAVVRSSGDQARRLAREVVALLIVFALLLLSLPFAAGYLVGRTRQAREDTRRAS